MRYATNVYVMKCREFYKIGVTNSVENRKAQLSTAIPFEIELIANYRPKVHGMKEYEGRKIVRKIERYLHSYFEEKWVRGEWFKLDADDLLKIPSLVEIGSGLKDVTETVIHLKKEITE